MYPQSDIRQINKTIDLATSNAYSKTQQQVKYPTYVQQFEWVLQDKNYNYMNSQEIQKEYQMMRKQIFRLNDLVVKQLQRLRKKTSRKRIITYTEPEKINEVRQKEIQNNQFILGMMTKEYKGLKVKSQTLQPKEAIEQQIQHVKEQISITKQKIISLKLKNKAIGNSIINTDQVLAELKQCQREYEVWSKKKKQFQVKLDKVNTETQKVIQNLDNITMESTYAQDYFKTKQKDKKQQQQKNIHLQAYNERLHSLQVLKKNHQIFSGLKQQKYHQLLKLLEGHIERDEKMNQRMQEIEYGLVGFNEEVQVLERKLKQIKQDHSTMGFYQSSNLEQSPDRSIDSDVSGSNLNAKGNPRLSMFVQKQRDKNVGIGQKTSGSKFVKNQLPMTAHQKVHDQGFNPKINTSKTSQFRLNLPESIQSKLSDKEEGKSQLIKSNQNEKRNKKIVGRNLLKEQKCQKDNEVHKNLDNSESNVYSEQIQVHEQKSTQLQTQIINQKDSLRQFEEVSLNEKSYKKPLIFDQLRQKIPESQKQLNLQHFSKQQKQRQYKQLSGEIRSMITKKVEKPIKMQEKITIDLEKIEENLDKVSRSRMRVKEELTNNFNKYVNAQQQGNKASDRVIQEQ